MRPLSRASNDYGGSYANALMRDLQGVIGEN